MKHNVNECPCDECSEQRIDHPISCVCSGCVDDANMICQCSEPEYENNFCQVCGRCEE